VKAPEPEQPGQLPPAEVVRLNRLLESYRRLAAWGVVRGVQIVGPADCPVVQQWAGFLHSPSGVPRLPLDGCKRSPCCGCTYVAVT